MFGILGYVIVNWNTIKYKITIIFASEVMKLLITQKPLDVQSWISDTMWVLINALRKPSLGASSHVTKILQAKSGQKMDDFEPIYLGNYQYWWKMVCDFWAHYQLPFLWLCSFIPTWILCFFFFFFFLTFFPFFLFLSGYLLLSR